MSAVETDVTNVEKAIEALFDTVKGLVLGVVGGVIRFVKSALGKL